MSEGRFKPAGEYIPQGVPELANQLFEDGMVVEAHELLGAAMDWAQTHKYYDRLMGNEER